MCEMLFYARFLSDTMKLHSAIPRLYIVSVDRKLGTNFDLYFFIVPDSIIDAINVVIVVLYTPTNIPN
jgi:hypothetical protein